MRHKLCLDVVSEATPERAASTHVRRGNSLNHGTDKPIQIEICNGLGAELDGLSIEMDEMWSFYHDKRHQLWLWWAIDHETNTPLAYVFGTREHKYLDELLRLMHELCKCFHWCQNSTRLHSLVISLSCFRK